jgi:phage terminase large subunit-like protein
LWCSPTVWKENSAEPNYALLKTGEVHLGLDLSTLNDLTACVATVKDDDGFVHVFPYVFTPSQGLEERASKSRAPYPQWVRDGKMISIAGKVLDYELICQFLAREFEDCNIVSVNFDRWRIKDFAKEAERAGFAGNAQWVEVGQGFQSMSPRLEKTMELLLHGNIKHGGHPLMNFGIGNAIAVSDTAGNMKLGKDRSTQKIDQIVALVMSVYSCAVNLEAEVDIDTLIF